jgi:hypothetical protein
LFTHEVVSVAIVLVASNVQIKLTRQDTRHGPMTAPLVQMGDVKRENQRESPAKPGRWR